MQQDARQRRLRELSAARHSRDLTTAEWWEVAALLRAVGDETQAAKAERMARRATQPEPTIPPPGRSFSRPSPAPSPRPTGSVFTRPLPPGLGCLLLCGLGLLIALPLISVFQDTVRETDELHRGIQNWNRMLEQPRLGRPGVDGAAQPAPDFEILDVGTRVTEANEVWSKFAWQVELVNRSTAPILLDVNVQWEDKDGFVVDSDVVYNVPLAAGETRTVSDYQLVTANVAGSIDSIAAQVEASR